MSRNTKTKIKEQVVAPPDDALAQLEAMGIGEDTLIRIRAINKDKHSSEEREGTLAELHEWASEANAGGANVYLVAQPTRDGLPAKGYFAKDADVVGVRARIPVNFVSTPRLWLPSRRRGSSPQSIGRGITS